MENVESYFKNVSRENHFMSEAKILAKREEADRAGKPNPDVETLWSVRGELIRKGIYTKCVYAMRALCYGCLVSFSTCNMFDIPLKEIYENVKRDDMLGLEGIGNATCDKLSQIFKARGWCGW